MLFVAKLGVFRIQQDLSNSNSNLIPFQKVIIDQNYYPEGLTKLFPANYSKKFV